jgi:hypothetical protein
MQKGCCGHGPRAREIRLWNLSNGKLSAMPCFDLAAFRLTMCCTRAIGLHQSRRHAALYHTKNRMARRVSLLV